MEARGYDDELGSYVSYYGGTEVDASLLLLARYGYVDYDAPRMRGTAARVEERLGADGLVYRYLQRGTTYDGLPPGEGAFVICSFWAVECMARQGRLAEARRRFERLLSRANDVGLLAEEVDPRTGAALGNFPQALSHIGLVNAAACLAECAGEEGAA